MEERISCGERLWMRRVAVSSYSKRSVAQCARGRGTPGNAPGSARRGASLYSTARSDRAWKTPRAPADMRLETHCCLTHGQADPPWWGAHGDAVRAGGGRRGRLDAQRWQRDVASGRPDLLTLAVALWPSDAAVVGLADGAVVYHRRRGPVRSLSDLNAFDPPRAIRFTDDEIARLQGILRQRFGLEYSAEQAQDAGRAILRFYGYKLLRDLQNERVREKIAEKRTREGDRPITKQSI